MNEEKSKIIAELADYVRSDLPVQEIIDNFQYLIQKLDYTNRVAAITKAIERLNDGCTYDYVAAGLREWYGIDISSQELALLLYGAEGLLPREIRYKRQLAKQEKKANQTEYSPHRKRPTPGSLFHISPQSPHNPINSSKNLPISRQNRFLPDMYVGNISCRYPNYVTYSVFNYRLCLIRH